MFFFHTRIISSSDGSYGDNSDLNIAELKAIMNNLIINEEPRKYQGVIWADTNKKENKVQMVKDATTQTEVATSSSGGRVWVYPSKKKKPAVKTFAL